MLIQFIQSILTRPTASAVFAQTDVYAEPEWPVVAVPKRDLRSSPAQFEPLLPGSIAISVKNGASLLNDCNSSPNTNVPSSNSI